LSKGTLGAKDEFLVKRRALFIRLDNQLRGMARFGSGLKNAGSIKRMLGISSKSYLYQGEIRGYEQTVKRVAKASELLKKGTYIGLALDVGGSALGVREACSLGREEECTQAKFVEGGKLAFGVGGAVLGGEVGAALGVAVCAVVFGIPTGGAGALGCAIVGGAAGGASIGLLGNKTGEIAGSRLYELSRSHQ